MRISNDSLSLLNADVSSTAVSMATSFVLDPTWLAHISQYSIQLVFTGAPVGIWRLEGSNDRGVEDRTNGGWNGNGVSNWSTIVDSDQAIISSGDHVWDVRESGYRWVRVVWQRSSGTGSLTSAVLNGKGV